MMAQQLKTFQGKVNTGLKTGSEAAKNGANAVYTAVMNNPKTASAVVLGASAAAALLWVANRNGTFRALQQKVLGTVRSSPRRRRVRASS